MPAWLSGEGKQIDSFPFVSVVRELKGNICSDRAICLSDLPPSSLLLPFLVLILVIIPLFIVLASIAKLFADPKGRDAFL